ncbi:MAG: tetratricopeptide repeat protein [Nitrospiria bacterium]
MQEKKGDSVLSPEIAKLTEKLQKDPSSNLFFPLAEEYIRSGMLEEAVIILKDGLKIHPFFSAARVSLGKVYLQKGRVAEAKTEFEKVLAQNPDNLMAQKKLALIYRDEGNLEKARQLCETILLTNPKDVEMKKLVLEIDGMRTQSAPRAAAAEKEHGPELSPETPRSHGQSLTPAPVDQAGKGASDSRQGTESHEIPRDLQKKPEDQPAQQYSAPPIEPQPPVDLSQAQQGHEEGKDLSALGGLPAQGPGQLSGTPVDEPGHGSIEEEVFSELLGSASAKNKFPPSKEPVSAMTAIPETPEEPEAAVSEEALATVGIAELYIKQGHYEYGIEIYRKILEQDPDNGEVRQRLEDALALANLLTKRPTEARSQMKTVTTPEPPAKAEEGPPPDGPARSSPEQIRQGKVQRLQAWLEQLKRSQNQ